MLKTMPALGVENCGKMIDLLPAAIYRTDAQGLITYYNPAAAQLWGVEPELGQSEFCGSWKLYWPDGRSMPHSECPMALTLKTGKPHHGREAIAERPDGTRVPFVAYPTPIFDSAGQMTGAVNMLVDISGRRQYALSQERLAAIVNCSDDAIISKDLDGMITSWNPGAERIFGYSSDEAIGRSITMLIPDDHLDEEPKILAQIKQGQHIDHYETVRRRKDGTLINISLTVSPLRAPNGEIIGASKIARDITESKRHQEQQALMLLEMRHRIKNTLTTVQSIASQTLTEIQSEQLDMFRSRLTALAGVHDLLTAKNWRETTINAVVQQSLRPFQKTYTNRISVECGHVALTPNLAQTLTLVLHELATNAVKYGALSNDSGRVSITCGSDASRTLLKWSESGGPPVINPVKSGFGSRLLTRALVDYKTQLEYRPEGLFFSVELRGSAGS